MKVLHLMFRYQRDAPTHVMPNFLFGTPGTSSSELDDGFSFTGLVIDLKSTGKSCVVKTRGNHLKIQQQLIRTRRMNGISNVINK